MRAIIFDWLSSFQETNQRRGGQRVIKVYGESLIARCGVDLSGLQPTGEIFPRVYERS